MLHMQTLIDLWHRTHTCAPLSGKEIQTVGNALLNLQRGLTGDRKLAGAGYMDNNAALGAYLLYYFPVTYEQITLALDSVAFKVSKDTEVRLLDIGSGPGPASAALVDFLIKEGVSAQSITVTLVDSSPKALSLAKDYFRRTSPAVRIITKKSNLESFSETLLSGTYDCIVASHVLNELWKNAPDSIQKRLNLLLRITGHLHEKGFFLVSEPALLKTSRELITLAAKATENGLNIAAPCPFAINSSHQCPVFLPGQSPSASCHATVTAVMDKAVMALAREAGLSREAVKMTYFVFTKTQSEPNVSNEKKRYRIVSDAMLNKSGRIRFLLCDGQSRIALSAKEKDPHAMAEGFYTLTRYDTVTLTNPEPRGDKTAPAFGVGTETRLQISRFTKIRNKTTLLQAKSRSRNRRK